MSPPAGGQPGAVASNEVWTCHCHGALVLSGGIPVYLPTERNPQGLIGPIDPAALDEAWAGFMKFHPLFSGHYAMALDNLGPDDPGIIATQSTHKWNEATRVAVETRKAIRRLRHQYEAEPGGAGSPPWFFDPFVPEVVTVTGSPHTPDLLDEPWEDVPTEVLLAEQQCWLLRPGARWHGFEHVTDGWAMTDPNKLTLVTPSTGIPADTSTGAFRRRCSPGSCANAASSRRRTTSTPFSSSSHPASR
jgi:arginine/lysine/ornithine decarboxylase